MRDRPRDIHHRINRKLSHNHQRSDPIEVDAIRHRFFHYLFGCWDAQHIADDLNKYWIDSNLVMIVVPKKEVEEYVKERRFYKKGN